LLRSIEAVGYVTLEDLASDTERAVSEIGARSAIELKADVGRQHGARLLTSSVQDERRLFQCAQQLSQCGLSVRNSDR
jgi:hypothetical protein